VRRNFNKAIKYLGGRMLSTCIICKEPFQAVTTKHLKCNKCKNLCRFCEEHAQVYKDCQCKKCYLENLRKKTKGVYVDCGHCGKTFRKLVNSQYCDDCRKLCNKCFQEKRYKKEEQCQKCYLEKEKAEHRKVYTEEKEKTCTSCMQPFKTVRVSKTKCDGCKNKAAAERWAKTGEKYKSRNEEARKLQKIHNNKMWVANSAVLANMFGDGHNFVCQKCGYTSGYKVQFSLHHVGKNKTIIPAQFLRSGTITEAVIKKECLTLLCEDCHRTEHTKVEAPYFKELFALIAKKCQLCGEEPMIGCVNFHHVSTDEKSYNVSKRNHCSRLARVIDEVEKCAILCCKCHNLYHYLVREGQPIPVLKTIGEVISSSTTV